MATITVTKEKIGVEDIQFWASGAATFTRTTSTGGSQTLNALSAQDVPVEDASAEWAATKVEGAIQELVKSGTRDAADTPAPHTYGGGIIWTELTTNGATAVVIDNNKSYVDRWITVKLLSITQSESPTAFRPGGAFDDRLGGITVEKSCYTEAGNDGTEDNPSVVFYWPFELNVRSLTDSDGDVLLALENPEGADELDFIRKLRVYADSSTGYLSAKWNVDPGNEFAVALKIEYSPDQGHQS